MHPKNVAPESRDGALVLIGRGLGAWGLQIAALGEMVNAHDVSFGWDQRDQPPLSPLLFWLADDRPKGGLVECGED